MMHSAKRSGGFLGPWARSWSSHLSEARAAASAASGCTAAAASGTAAATSSAAGSAWRQGLLPGDLQRARALALPAGALAGIFGSVAGSGGAAVTAPLLSLACRSIPQRVVAGTSLAAVLATAAVSTATFTAGGCLDPPASLLICAPAVLAAPLGARLASRLNCAVLRWVLGYFLLVAAPLIPLKAWLFAGREEQPAGQREEVKDRREARGTSVAAPAGAIVAAGAGAVAAALPAAEASVSWAAKLWQRMPDGVHAAGLAATGAVAGFSSGLLGIGGGTVATPLVALLMPYSQAMVLGTTLLAMIPPTAVGLLQHHRLGNIDWRLAGILAAGASVGAAAGSTAAVHSPPGVLEACFTLGMLVLARMTLRPLR